MHYYWDLLTKFILLIYLQLKVIDDKSLDEDEHRKSIEKIKDILGIRGMY